MVRQVVAHECVEEVGVVVEVSGRDRDELAIPGRAGVLGCPGQEPSGLRGFLGSRARPLPAARETRMSGPVEDLAGRLEVTADQAAEQNLEVRGHGVTVERGADDPLTAT